MSSGPGVPPVVTLGLRPARRRLESASATAVSSNAIFPASTTSYCTSPSACRRSVVSRTSARVTGVASERLCSDLRFRTRPITSLATSKSTGRPPQSRKVPHSGHGAQCTEASCHHDQDLFGDERQDRCEQAQQRRERGAQRDRGRGRRVGVRRCRRRGLSRVRRSRRRTARRTVRCARARVRSRVLRTPSSPRRTPPRATRASIGRAAR